MVERLHREQKSYRAPLKLPGFEIIIGLMGILDAVAIRESIGLIYNPGYVEIIVLSA